MTMNNLRSLAARYGGHKVEQYNETAVLAVLPTSGLRCIAVAGRAQPPFVSARQVAREQRR